MIQSASSAFSALSEHQQAHFLARFSYELTIVARGGYQPGTDQLSDPVLLRRLNELQHRVTSAIVARLSNDQERYPDDVLINNIAGSDSNSFSQSVQAAFSRAWKMAFGAEVGGVGESSI